MLTAVKLSNKNTGISVHAFFGKQHEACASSGCHVRRHE